MSALRALVRDVIAQSESVEWADVAEAVLASIDPADYREALAVALPNYCRHVGISLRADGPVRPPKPAQKLPGGWKVPGIRDGWDEAARLRS